MASEPEVLDFEEKIDLKGEEICSDLESRRHKEITCTNSQSVVSNLRKILNENILGCDLMICLFIAALKSFRADGVLRPFPPHFVKNNEEKNFDLLNKTCDKIPPISNIISAKNSLSKDVAELLKWLFIDKGFPVLKPCSVTEVPLLNIRKNPAPQNVFKVHYKDSTEENWQCRTKNKEIFYAFHGSLIYNYYSILKTGLLQHFSNKQVLFGPGIYLSNELSIATNYAPFGETWKNSIQGMKHSIIAVCEVINDSEKVKCKDASNKKRAVNTESFGNIPEKYFVVTDSEMVKVKFLLVYKRQANPVRSFTAKNLFWIVIFLYILLLISIRFFNSATWHKFLRNLKQD